MKWFDMLSTNNFSNNNLMGCENHRSQEGGNSQQMGLICLATRTLMLARGTKYNTFRNITHGVTWTGLHMAAEILFWLTMTVFG